jgi:threonine dehydrogenase-like Zn-dependent dehydrogenase
MLAAVFKKRGVLGIEDRPEPAELAEDEVLLKVEGCGVCGTDLHILSDPPGHPATEGVILGHEIVARIVDQGAKVREFDIGTRVLVDANLKCGICPPCRKGKFNHCKNWTTIGIFLDGGFTRIVKAPQKALHPLRDDVPLKEAVWGEILSCVVGSTDRVRIQPGELAVVIGAGPAGMMQRTINPGDTNLRDYVSELTAGEGADAVVDAVGSQFGVCVDLVARGGTISLFGMNTQARAAIPQCDITRKEVTIVGSYVGRNTFPRSIAVLESQVLNLSGLVSHDISVAELPDAIQAARQGKAMKILVRPE